MEYLFKDLLPLDEVLAREGYYKDWTHLDPEVFYSLTQISNFIKTKGYGVDVRLLIAQLAEHFGLKTAQVVDLGNLLQQKFTNLEGVTQSFTNNINSLVAQMEADKNAVIANVTVDSEVILARGGKPTLQARLDETTAELVQTIKKGEIVLNVKDFGAVGDGVTDDTVAFKNFAEFVENKTGVNIIIPSGTYIIGERITFTLRSSIINNFGLIKVKGGIITPYGFISIGGSKVTINGLMIDGNEENIIDEEQFGYSSLLNTVGNVSDIVFNNTDLRNSAYSCITMSGGSRNVIFNNTYFENIGEHCFYISGNGGTKGVHINNTKVNTFGMHNVNGRLVDAEHFAGFVKTRSNTGVPNEDINITNLEIVNNPESRALYVIGSQGLGSGTCKDIYADGLFMISLTTALDQMKYTFANCYGGSMSFGVAPSTYKYDLTYINCNLLGGAVIGNVNLQDCTIELSADSNSIISVDQSISDSLTYNRCKFIFQGRGLNFDRPDYHRNLTFNECTFFNELENPSMIRLYNYASGKLSFNKCKVEGFSSSLIRQMGSGVVNVDVTFTECYSDGALSELPNTKYFNCNDVKYIGGTAERPIARNLNKGFNYFDTDLNKPIWFISGTNWVDSTGTTV